ncbi:MAG TPA: glycosyltransferase family A protein [Pirellulales bacterium]|nr:glycosyltransferase family A protein [Pirellulales bacterium]
MTRAPTCTEANPQHILRAETESPNGPAPTVSIILPTYNRERFLPAAFAAIRSQAFTDWELIVVDDGSTDDSRSVSAELARDFSFRFRYAHQENRGPYGARNTGLDLARGRYVAFYDSDDLWLPHHLQHCVNALDNCPEVDWVFGACRMVDERTGREIAPSTFYVDGAPRPFLSLRFRPGDCGLRIIDDPDANRCMILHGLYCGLQNSVIRRTLFERDRFEAASRNEAEDQLIVVRKLAEGRRFAYYDDVHVIYNVHEANSSAAAAGSDWTKLARVFRLEIAGYEQLANTCPLSRREKRAIRQRLSNAYFWQLGYSVFWLHGQQDEALRAFHKGLSLRPLNPRFWKTYTLASLRRWLYRSREFYAFKLLK